jgi:pyridoxal phosphate enzyme (YggS family)
MKHKQSAIYSNHLQTSYSSLQDEIHKQAHASGRSPDDITLVVVTKKQSIASIKTMHDLGHRHFGENRIEEASDKIPVLSAATQSSPSPVIWHMIGHIQSRKARSAITLFDHLHSIDSIKLAKRLSNFACEENSTVSLLLQCNVSGESTKSGFVANDTSLNSSQWSALVQSISEISVLPNIIITGLMTMAPIASNPENSRSTFRTLRLLRNQISHRFPQLSIKHLSMGMSADYGIAIQEGATILRIGTSIFGLQ